MPIKKGGAKKSVKTAGRKRTAAKNPKVLKEIILHEEWPKTEALFKAEEKHGVILEPDREITAKPEFAEVAAASETPSVNRQARLDPTRFAKANARRAERAWWVPGVSVFIRLSGWLLIPLIIGTTLGKWLDRKYDTAPWLFLSTISVAFVVCMFGLIKNTMEEFKKIEKAANNNNGKNSFGKNK